MVVTALRVTAYRGAVPARMPLKKSNGLSTPVWRPCRGVVLALSLACPALCGALDWSAFQGHRTAPLEPRPTPGRSGFTTMSPAQTGVTFTNTLADERSLANQILLNGSGVALGDVNGDGWVDAYFSSLERPGVLYLNRGG